MTKKIAIISFTGSGARTAQRLLKAFQGTYDCQGYIKKKFWRLLTITDEGKPLFPVQDWEEDPSSWTGKRFMDSDCLIFIGAVGIAVRFIAPYVKDKMEDPAVIVIDEQGSYAIPILSGHVGGANQLAREAANALGALPVITTATDLNGKFAVDVFARDNHMIIGNRKLAKEISARILEGEKIRLRSDLPLKGDLPKEIVIASQQEEPDIWITWKKGKESQSRILFLIPRQVILGMGCRKGVEKERVMEAVKDFCDSVDLDIRSIKDLATIDRKKEENGLIKTAMELGAGFLTFSSQELSALQGPFSESEFVKKTVGVGNVCERAAVLGTGLPDQAVLIAGKMAEDGVTAAAAIVKKPIYIGRKIWEK